MCYNFKKICILVLLALGYGYSFSCLGFHSHSSNFHYKPNESKLSFSCSFKRAKASSLTSLLSQSEQAQSTSDGAAEQIENERKLLLKEMQLQWTRMRTLMSKGLIKDAEDMAFVNELEQTQGVPFEELMEREQAKIEDLSKEDDFDSFEDEDDTEIEQAAPLREQTKLKDAVVGEEQQEMGDIGGGFSFQSKLITQIKGSQPSFQEWAAQQHLMPLGTDVFDARPDGKRKKRRDKRKESRATSSQNSFWLHSTAPLPTPAIKTSEEYIRGIRKVEKTSKNPLEVLELAERSLRKSLNNDAVICVAIKSLLRLKEPSFAEKLFSARRQLLQDEKLVNCETNSTVSVLVAFARVGMHHLASEIFEELHTSKQLLSSEENFVLLEIVASYFLSKKEADWTEGLKFVDRLLSKPKEELQLSDYNRVISLLGTASLIDQLFQVVDKMQVRGIEPSHETLEFISTAMVKSVSIEKKCSTMRSLPRPEIPEIVLMGRSNAGKSSLVNMLLNRKALASTSATPGRTRSFNFYHINEGRQEPAGQSASASFYMVDVPGLGFAETVDENTADGWRSLVIRYLEVRESLAAVLHLVDSRHGLQKADKDLMKIVKQSCILERGARYFIVLTKADKGGNDIQKSLESVKQDIEGNVFMLQDVPVIVTSSKTRLGRQELWSLLHKALSEKKHMITM